MLVFLSCMDFLMYPGQINRSVDDVRANTMSDRSRIRVPSSSSPSYWQSMDVVDAAELTAEQFEREYMEVGKPVVIRNDPGARALQAAFSIDKLLDLCGTASPELGRRLVHVLGGFPSQVQQELSRRLESTYGISLDEVIATLRADGPIQNLKQFFESGYFSSAKTSPLSRWNFTEKSDVQKDWMHPADYLWPPSIHSWNVATNCPAFAVAVSKTVAETPVGFIPSISHPANMMEIEDFYLFASTDGVRAYHPHRHGEPNHVMLLLLQGHKQLVTWPWQEKQNLYPVMDDLLTPNEIGEVTPIFMVNGFNVNLTRQPALANVRGGVEGIAGPGDLLFIPCGTIHSLASKGDMVALGWIPTQIAGSRIDELKDCPNPNGQGYPSYQGYQGDGKTNMSSVLYSQPAASPAATSVQGHDTPDHTAGQDRSTSNKLDRL